MRNCLRCGTRFDPGNFNEETGAICRSCRPAVKRERERLRRQGIRVFSGSGYFSLERRRERGEATDRDLSIEDLVARLKHGADLDSKERAFRAKVASCETARLPACDCRCGGLYHGHPHPEWWVRGQLGKVA